MSDNSNGSKKRTHKILWLVEDVKQGNNTRSFWTRIGIAFENRDGSFSLQFSALPLTGRVQMRDPKKSDEDQAEVNALT